ncbi:class I SAM-dependent methyltransferase [Roseovarius sp. S1116L3]|uniref:class I SAM-dependent methyltransferase n=1 Tax=Roseovarius roseus TaxID=3342636 RepID=UPI00372C3974
MPIPYHYRLRLLDFWNAVRMGHLGIQRRLAGHLKDQQKSWERGYTNGYFYQGLEDLGITGAKPTGFRFRQYEVDDVLRGADVLDIGSNAGFVAIYCARLAKSVVGVELNPYLNRIGRDAAAYLGVDNLSILETDFGSYQTDQKYDVVLSLSNHHTIDGNLNMGFEQHIARIADLLRSDGVMLFESHNVFGPGTGGEGDDGDMDQKIAILSKHFTIERYRMVHCYLTHGKGDIDKLFIVARKSSDPKAIDFDLNVARESYSWTHPQ